MKRINVRPRNKQLIVLIDLDNVLLDFEEQFLKKFREIYPDEPYIPCDERNTLDPAEQYATLPGTACNIEEMVKSIYNGKHFFRDAPEIEGGVQAVKAISRMDGVDVFIVTTPTFDVCKYKISALQKNDWVKNHMGKSWLGKLILTSDKTAVKGHLLIDDRTNITGVVKKPSWEHVVFTSCANRDVDIGDRTRLENWTDGEWRGIIEEWRMKILYMD